ncbi:unnamed protein product [Candidula unifasciata]|uniref:Iron-binding zinc finger CDGSH type domain-containing protein n=1 Tax=Candidula unifasciata TaxID=100452 RepID=A0A8S4A4P0_9EUPU|nr:unnamed protein product [Candidula unifasciata]
MAASLVLNSTGKSCKLQCMFLSFQKASFQRLLYSAQRYRSSQNNSSDPKSEKPQAETQTLDPVKGKICDKKPMNVLLEAGKKYLYCTCGYSKNQPFCDSSHKAPNFVANRPHHSRYRPLPFTVEETKEYRLCLCKQSNNRPFCDGTHKRPDIQTAVLS